MQYELERLKKLNSTLEPKHISLTDDSKGYDIVSYDESGNEFYIEPFSNEWFEWNFTK